MKKQLPNKIPHDVVENISLYRLGIFGDGSYELVELFAEDDSPPHPHENSSAIFYMILGEGKIILNGNAKQYKPGEIIQVDKNVKHGLKPKSDTLFLSVQTPPIKSRKTGKEDINFRDSASS